MIGNQFFACLEDYSTTPLAYFAAGGSNLRDKAEAIGTPKDPKSGGDYPADLTANPSACRRQRVGRGSTVGLPMRQVGRVPQMVTR